MTKQKDFLFCRLCLPCFCLCACFCERYYCLTAVCTAGGANYVAEMECLTLYALGKARAVEGVVRTAICRMRTGMSHSYYHSFTTVAKAQ